MKNDVPSGDVLPLEQARQRSAWRRGKAPRKRIETTNGFLSTNPSIASITSLWFQRFFRCFFCENPATHFFLIQFGRT